MKFLTKVWKWLEGKKTIIGGTFLLAGQLVPDPIISTVLSEIGQWITLLGLGDKGRKSAIAYIKKKTSG